MNDASLPSSKSPSKRLSASERDALQREFTENGYVVLRDVVARDRLQPLCEDVVRAYEDARRSGSLFDGGGMISGHLNCFPGEGVRFVYETLVEHGIVDLVKAVTPRSFTSPSVRCNVNLPDSVAQHNHIDGTWINHFTIVNVAPMDTDSVNGAMS